MLLRILNYQNVIGIKAALALAAATVLALEAFAARHQRPRLRRLADFSLAILGIASALAWWNFGAFHFGGGFLHYHEFFHYYLGSKYSAELEYTRLYDCVAVVEVEQGRRAAVDARWIRDLTTNELRRGSPDVADPARCRSHFASQARWDAFTHDVTWFRDRVNDQKWRDLQMDHGYNATPLWNAAGHLLANTGPASRRQMLALAAIDPALLAAMWLVVWWAFGWRAACVAAVWWGTNYPARYTYIGGAFLREDWLALTVASICFARRGRPAASGFSLVWASLLRIFPAFVVSGLAMHAVVTAIRRRTIARAHLRFAAGALAALALLLPVSFAVGHGAGGGVAAWTGFAENSRKHLATPLTNNVGLRMVVSTAPGSRSANVRELWLDSPWDIWMDARRETFDRRRPLYYAIAAAFLALLGYACLRQEDWVALALGVGAIPFLADLSSYYYGVLLVFALLWTRHRVIGIAVCVASAMTCLIPAVLSQDDDRHVAISVVILLLSVFVTVVCSRPRAASAPDSIPVAPL